ncbi:MAG: flagellar basal body P-ring formation chaperone FlgA [Verrucomicrobiae bacterium]|nr:flagellar basal body P-ring formation chaperone FlgA [Verrucomicrobiae bacterium]
MRTLLPRALVVVLSAMWISSRGAGASTPADPPERSATVLDEVALRVLLTEVLQRDHVGDRGELELTLMRHWPPLTITNDAPIELRVLELPTLGVTAHFIVRFELRAGDQSLGVWQMPVTARIWREVWVARRPLRRGELLTETDRAVERRDVLALPAPWPVSAPDESNWELAENLPAGAPLLSRHLRPRTLVRRGQLVEAVVRQGALAVSLKVEALEDGAAGQVIRVRNQQSRREFRGMVENETTVRVSL